MDVVEALDAWIDEEIDDLSDEDLEIILELLDAVAASSLSHVDAENIYDDDIAELVDLAGGSPDDRAYCDSVLRAALFGESASTTSTDISPVETDDSDSDYHEDGLDEVTLGPADDLEDAHDGLDDLDDDDRTDAYLEDDDESAGDDDLTTDALDNNAFDDDVLDDELEDDIDDDDAPQDDDVLDEDDLEDATDALDDDDNDDVVFDEFEDELDGLDEDDLEDATEALDDVDSDDVVFDEFEDELDGLDEDDLEDAIRPVELREFDELGPAFLPEVGERSNGGQGTARRLSDVLLPAFLIVGLAVFAFGMVQLINSLNEEDGTTEVASSGVPATTTTSETNPQPTEPPEPTATVAATPLPVADGAPVPRVAIRLVTGDVVLASSPDTAGDPAVITQLYDASDEDLEPARQVIWLEDNIGIVDTDGNVFVVNPDARRPQPNTVYDVEDGFGEAVKIASSDDQIAVLTEDGNIGLTPSDGQDDPDDVQVVWDALVQGARATDIAAVNSLVPFVLDDGNALMILTGSNNALLSIWSAGDQPQAFNVGGSEAGILLGVGQGAVARYNLDSGDGEQPLESVWDPFSQEDAPAIGYSSVGEDTLIVTGDGSVVLSDGDGGGPLLWDPETTELRAFAALSGDTQVVVLLETGSVVRVPIDPDGLIESIWDITDETLIPANQIAVESLSN